MNTSIILAAGVGQRMRNGGLPKQFLKLMGKPIVVYTIEKFEMCKDIDQIIVVCHNGYIDYMDDLIKLYNLTKVKKVVVGGNDRQSSVKRGLDAIAEENYSDNDIVIIHDGVRPLVDTTTISENIRISMQYGCAVTVHPVTESVVITNEDKVGIGNFKKRADTYSMTSPQSFKFAELYKIYSDIEQFDNCNIPLLDAAMVYADAGNDVHLVKEQGTNIKITTPEDFYYLKAILELEENKYIFGI